jgi:GAF domain-containing protein
VRPIPETLVAIDELDPSVSDDDLLEQLTRSSERVRALAPDVIGMSVAMNAHGVTLTLVSSDEDIATLDAFQYLNGGPCVEAVDPTGGVETTRDDLFSEARWRLFAEASAAHAVRSTLTLPIVRCGRVIGTVNLYGASEQAFGGHYAALAEILGGWAPGAVANADLSFSSRGTARQAPEILRASAVMESAVGVLASTLDLGFREARRRLERAAEQAGVSPGRLATAVLALQFHR